MQGENALSGVGAVGYLLPVLAVRKLPSRSWEAPGLPVTVRFQGSHVTQRVYSQAASSHPLLAFCRSKEVEMLDSFYKKKFHLRNHRMA